MKPYLEIHFRANYMYRKVYRTRASTQLYNFTPPIIRSTWSNWLLCWVTYTSRQRSLKRAAAYLRFREIKVDNKSVNFWHCFLSWRSKITQAVWLLIYNMFTKHLSAHKRYRYDEDGAITEIHLRDLMHLMDSFLSLLLRVSTHYPGVSLLRLSDS